MILRFLQVNGYAWALQVLILSSTACLLPRVLRITDPKSRLPGAQLALFACLIVPLVGPQSSIKGSLSFASEDTLKPLPGRRIPARTTTPWALLIPAGAAIRLLFLGAGLWRLRGYRRSARTLDPLPATVVGALKLTGSHCRVALSNHSTGPSTFGLFQPVVLLPAMFLDLSPEAQRAIACHEMLHVRRRDWLAVLIEEFASALLWFQPAVYVLIADIRLAREQAVDAEVVALTKARTPYVQALLTVAGAPFGASISVAPSFLHRKHLKSRVKLLVEELSMSKTKLISANLTLAALLLGAGWISVTSFPLVAAPAQSAEPKKDAPAANDWDFSKVFPAAEGKRIRIGGNVSAANLLSKVSPVYPPEAKAAGIQGTVKLGVLIGTDGHIHDLALISGDPALAPTASDAVRQWVYRPTLLNGEPVEVITIIDVNFTLEK